MFRSSFRLSKCVNSNITTFAACKNSYRFLDAHICQKFVINRTYIAATKSTTKELSSALGAHRKVVPLPAKVTEMKLRCNCTIQVLVLFYYFLILFVACVLGTEFDQNGAVKTTAGEFLKSDFCQHHSLLPRDLRTIDTYSVYQKPTILVRPEAILVNVAHLKALLKSDMVVLFDTYGSTDSYNQSIFIYDLQERLRSQKDGLPFEFRYSCT